MTKVVGGIRYSTSRCGVDISFLVNGDGYFMQTVTTNYIGKMLLKEEEYLDPLPGHPDYDDLPWFGQADNTTVYTDAGPFLLFDDTPNRPIINGIYWRGTLSYVEYQNGRNTIVWTISYGWKVENGKIVKQKLQKAMPSKFHQQQLLWRGKSKKK